MSAKLQAIACILVSCLMPLHAYIGGCGVHVRQCRTRTLGSFSCAPCFKNKRTATAPRNCIPAYGSVLCHAKKRAQSSEGEEDIEELDRKLRKEIGEENYAKLVAAAEQREQYHAENFVDDGLDWPSEEYPIEVPAFTRKVAAGMIGRQAVGSPVFHTVLTEECRQMRDEFNMDVFVVAVAERHANKPGRMLLSEKGLTTADIDGAPAQAWQDYKEEAFSVHIQSHCQRESRTAQGGASMVVIECSGPEREISKDLWAVMSAAFERWLARGFHVVFADADDTQVAQYVLACVLTDLEDWEAFTEAYEQEEAALGPPTQPFDPSRIEGIIHQLLKEGAQPPITETREDIIKEHERVFGINPVEAARVKELRLRAGGVEEWEERDYKSAKRIGVANVKGEPRDKDVTKGGQGTRGRAKPGGEGRGGRGRGGRDGEGGGKWGGRGERGGSKGRSE